MWGRERLDTDNQQYTHVNGVDAVIMGHTVTQNHVSVTTAIGLIPVQFIGEL